jgi:hypothetical protein
MLGHLDFDGWCERAKESHGIFKVDCGTKSRSRRRN